MNWQENNKAITKEFQFDNFKSSLDFVNKVGGLSEKANHHPDVLIHSYKKVKITLQTHSENKVTQKDWDLAKQIDTIKIK